MSVVVDPFVAGVADVPEPADPVAPVPLPVADEVAPLVEDGVVVAEEVAGGVGEIGVGGG